MRNVVLIFGGVAAALLGAAILLNAGWDHPPIHTVQGGFRGLSMGQLSTPWSEKAQVAANQLPDALPAASPKGDKATASYKNVKVLTDLSTDQFNRLMLGVNNWVAPQDQSCNYCHNPDDLSDDTPYTKRVSRVMLQMTRAINKDYQAHVGVTGVTCYTCHRGKPLPANVWFKETPQGAGGAAATNDGMGHPNAVNGLTAMNTDPFSGLLDDKGAIRVQSLTALPAAYGASIQATEKSYSLMIAISKGLGVNCTFCHNAQAFDSWAESTPARVTAWQGIQLTRDLNTKYLVPLQKEWPANRLGPAGDGPKVVCATCHAGANKPLLGVSLAKDWPELNGVSKP
jgi:photosynthetic reaction center cytochrome c subunit